MVSVLRVGPAASTRIGPGRGLRRPGMGVRGLAARRSMGRGLLCRGGEARGGSGACGRPEPPVTGVGAGAAPRAVRACRRVRALRRAGGGGDQPAAAAGTGRRRVTGEAGCAGGRSGTGSGGGGGGTGSVQYVGGWSGGGGARSLLLLPTYPLSGDCSLGAAPFPWGVSVVAPSQRGPDRSTLPPSRRWRRAYSPSASSTTW